MRYISGVGGWGVFTLTLSIFQSVIRVDDTHQCPRGKTNVTKKNCI